MDINVLLRNLDDAQSLLYYDYDTINSRVNTLASMITDYAVKYSPVYSASPTVVSKDHLRFKPRWYINNVPFFANKTSGTTSNKPFFYRIWSDVYKPIEQTHHYKAVLDEFGMGQSPLKILYCFISPSRTKDHDDVAAIIRTNDIIMSHGLGDKAEVHRVLAGSLYYTNNHKYYERLLEYAINHKIDVILAQGSMIAAIAWHAARLRLTGKICRLLSNTGSKLDVSDAEYLKSNGLIDDWCDHMRCWDGGATFITCKHYTYHLQDALSYAHEIDGKLVSIDYYSLPSPFVNYWNGDFCTIGDEYQRCQCGRAFRPFTIDRTREMAVASRNSGIIKENIRKANGSHKIKRIEGYNKRLLIVLRDHLKLDEIESIKATTRLDIEFVVER